MADKYYPRVNKRIWELEKDELERLIWEMPTTELAKMLGVSDTAIGKRCKALGIEKPPRGYWQKKNGKKKSFVRVN